MIYLDNQSTTRVDPRVVEAMLPTFDSSYGNAGSTTHELGLAAADLVHNSAAIIASAIGASAREIVFTSGATESNNLAIFGYCQRRRTSGHIITAVTEHKAVLDPLARLEKLGYEITYLPVLDRHTETPGLIDLDQFADAIRDDTIFASVMLVNNEIGVIQPIAEIARLCHERDIVLHCDATAAVGQFPLEVDELDVDLMSFSAHKFYGPKGVGALYVRQSDRRIRLVSQIEGGGQQSGRRSGTLNVSGIVGMAKALEICFAEFGSGEIFRKFQLRNRLYERLCERLGELPLNGPVMDGPELHGFDGEDKLRLASNLNCQFPGIEGQSLMMGAPTVAVSSGSACTAAQPEPSHVLRALGLSEDEARSSIRFGIGRYNSEADIDSAADTIISAARKLREIGG